MDITETIAAIAALGVAAQGLVDTSKVLGGGISLAGFGYIRKALAPFMAALTLTDPDEPLELVRANWINGVDKEAQKSATRNLIRLGLTSTTAATLAAGVPSVDGAALANIAGMIERGETLSDQDLAVLARFDAVVDARLDAAYERADQFYRNSAKAAAAVVSVVIALVAAAFYFPVEPGETAARNYLVAIMVGLVAVPIAPIAKDLSSAITTAVKALKLGRT